MNQNNLNKEIKIIVVTGGIATGKSSASTYIRELGYTVVDIDYLVHKGYSGKNDLSVKLAEMFSKDILNTDGGINREVLGKIVLNDNKKLEILNSIVHEYVINEMFKQIEEAKAHGEKLIFLDIPLMFEQKELLNKRGLKYDEIWLVYVDANIQRERLSKRAKLENKNVEQALKIIEKQLPIDLKKEMSDKIIYNDKSIEEMQKQIKLLIDEVVKNN